MPRQGQNAKTIKERITQLYISADNSVELQYAPVPPDGQLPSRWTNVIKISRGPGVQFNNTKNGETTPTAAHAAS